MQSLTLITQLDRALSRELSPEAIGGYTDAELEQIFQALRSLSHHENTLRLAADRIELKAFEADLAYLCGERDEY